MSLCAKGLHKMVPSNVILRVRNDRKGERTIRMCEACMAVRREKDRVAAQERYAERRSGVMLCRNGLHPMVGDNVRLVPTLAGRVHRRCGACTDAKRERDRLSERLRTVEDRLPVERTDLPVSKFLVVSEPWMERKACVNVSVDVFYPGKGGSTEQAKKLCRSCPVSDDCLEYALRTREQYGIWGGLAWDAREKILLARRRAS